MRPDAALHYTNAVSSRRVDFRAIAAARSRVTLELERRGAWLDPISARRALEAQLDAFKGYVDESGLAQCG